MQLRDLFLDVSLNETQSADSELCELLSESLNVTEDWSRAEHLLLRAQARLPERLEISVALYKMYAYAGRHHEALMLIDSVLHQAAESAGFHPDYRRLRGSTLFQGATGATRIFLYSLKARGFVLLRKGLAKEALAVLSKLSELDPRDQVGGSVVLMMAKNLVDHADEPAN